MAAHSYILRHKKYYQQPGLQYLAIGHQGADLSSQWRTDPLSPREEIIHTVWFIVVCVFKDMVAGVAYAGVCWGHATLKIVPMYAHLNLSCPKRGRAKGVSHA